MNNEEIQNLIEKYLNDTATVKERNTLLDWYRSNHPDEVEWISENPNDEEEVKARIYNQLLAAISFDEDKVVKIRTNWYRMAAAAVLAIVCGTGLFFYLNDSDIHQSKAQLTGKKPVKNTIEIVPGSNKAILMLADGSEVILNDAEKGVVAKQGNIAVNKNQDGELVYNSSAKTSALSLKVTYNTIKTPRGGQYQITLSDGTKVWLNSESVLTFPIAFTGDKRKVRIEGEAYFEVAKNKALPFVVETEGQTIEVLGTHFNVNAYQDESAIRTTLVEGSVKVSNTVAMVILKAGQQSSVNAGVPIRVEKVNTEEIIAWKNGYFLFHDEELASILRKVSRWYDVEIEYRGNPGVLYFGGMVSRSKSITDVLKIMELTGNIHFKIEGRRVIVMP